MDAFAAALCKELSIQKIHYHQCFIIALFFGFFQFIMPLTGWFLSSRFQEHIASVDHWLVFLILSLIGVKILYESFQPMSNVLGKAENFKEALINEDFCFLTRQASFG